MQTLEALRVRMHEADADVQGHIHANLRSKPVSKAHDRRWAKSMAALTAARDEARNAYRAAYAEALASGEVRPVTSDESLQLAATGHPDNASTAAAARVLAKRQAARQAAMES